jgi:hypothetical protein
MMGSLTEGEKLQLINGFQSSKVFVPVSVLQIASGLGKVNVFSVLGIIKLM